MGKRMRKFIVILLAVFALGVIVFPIASAQVSAQPASVAMWIANQQIDNPAAVDVVIPMGPPRANNTELCGGTGSCPSGCPKPVQNLVFIDKGGGATVIKGVVMSHEVKPGSKGHQITASADCTSPDPNNPGTTIRWYKYVVTNFE